MSAEQHRQSSPKGPFSIQVVVVSTSRSPATDTSGARIVELCEAAGHRVLARTVVTDEIDAIGRALRGFEGDGQTQVVVLTGGTGLSATDVTPQALAAFVARPIPGFGELFRMLSWQQVGAAAMLSRATAGLCRTYVAFALPGSQRACELALDRLILPELGHLVREVQREEGATRLPALSPPAASEPEAEPVPEDEDEGPTLPPPHPLWRLGLRSVQVDANLGSNEPEADAAAAAHPDYPAPGWLRAVYDLGGEVLRGKQPDVPQPIEKLAPVLNVFDSAGERAQLKLPGGQRYDLYGFPDLQRPTSKVLAVGWGEPLAEVVALHRYPIMTGTSIDEERGLVPGRDVDVRGTCEAVTGRAPRDTSGNVFAVSGDTVWIQRGHSVVKWDGQRERSEGSPKQVLSTLVLHWSNK